MQSIHPVYRAPQNALDILLELDPTIIQTATAASASLVINFPDGFAFGDEHAPHVFVLSNHFYSAHLDEMFALPPRYSPQKSHDLETDGLRVRLHASQSDWT